MEEGEERMQMLEDVEDCCEMLSFGCCTHELTVAVVTY